MPVSAAILAQSSLISSRPSRGEAAYTSRVGVHVVSFGSLLLDRRTHRRCSCSPRGRPP